MAEKLIFLVLMLVLATMCIAATLYATRQRRLREINTYQWPPGLLAKLKRHFPDRSNTDYDLIDQALRQFFRAYLLSGRRFVSMPSEAADRLWHEFILYTRDYKSFCDRAFGNFLHHTPSVALKRGKKQTNEGLRRVWWYTCKEERIKARTPDRLPLLFAIDGLLKIPGGFQYSPDCEALRQNGNTTTQCGGDFSSSSFDGGTSGFGDSTSSAGSGSDSSGDGGGSSDSGGGDGGGGGCGGGGGD